MREKLLKIFVDADNYRVVHSSSSKVVEFIGLSDNQPIKKVDFIVFVDEDGNEILKNMWEITDHTVYYTCNPLNMKDFWDFPLIVVLTHLYESIMHLRHGAFTEKNYFKKGFSLDMVKYEVCMMELCVDLLDEQIEVDQFLKELHRLTIHHEDYCLESSEAIMKSYPWAYRKDECSQKEIETIRFAIGEMKRCIGNKKEWRNIWKLAYGIHNEPMTIRDCFMEVR